MLVGLKEILDAYSDEEEIKPNSDRIMSDLSDQAEESPILNS